MKKDAKTDREAFENVLRHFYVNDKPHGALQAMADAIPVSSRQVVERWRKHGIPMKYAARLKELTGMLASEIWPENFR